MKLSIAADPNGGIGYKNRLPWIKLQGDLPRFKYLTDNQTVIMGRNTWDSLPIKPLYNSTI
jgi:dihydrofolate reductase